MPAIHKKETRLKLQFVTNTDQSIHAGLVAVEAMARGFGLWKKVRQLSCLDPRKDKKRGQEQNDAALVGQRHHLKGEKEQLFSEVLNGLDLHRPPCSSLRANQVYYLIAALAYGLMIAIKVLDLSDDCQSWRVKNR